MKQTKAEIGNLEKNRQRAISLSLSIHHTLGILSVCLKSFALWASEILNVPFLSECLSMSLYLDGRNCPLSKRRHIAGMGVLLESTLKSEASLWWGCRVHNWCRVPDSDRYVVGVGNPILKRESGACRDPDTHRGPDTDRFTCTLLAQLGSDS